MINGEREIKVIKPTSENDNKLRVAAYCRVSSDSTDQINSFLAQIRHYTDYINTQNNMKLVDIYADEGITGTSMKKREEFKRLLKDCENRKIDRVLVKSITRFARNALECIECIRKMSSCGVSIYFENDNIDTAKMNGEMMVYIKSAFAQGEAMSASKRMKTSVRMRMADGTYTLCKAPYGYTLNNGQLIPVPQEAEVVNRIFDMCLSGMGPCAISKCLNREKVGNIKWTITRISYILQNERYIGDCLMQKYYTPDILPFVKKRNYNKIDKYYYHNTHEAIISKDKFEMARKIMSERALKTMHKDIIKSPFDGLIFCEKCGWKYRKKIVNNQLVWKCRCQGQIIDECHAPSFLEDTLEKGFVRFFNKLKSNQKMLIDDTIYQLQLLKVKSNEGNSKIAEIDKDLQMLNSQIAVFVDLYCKGIMDEVLYNEKTDVLKKQISDLKLKRIKILTEDDEEMCIDELKKIKKVLDDNPKILTTFNETLLKSIIKKITVRQDGKLLFGLRGSLTLSMDIRS